jgi:hypothetical protein
MTSTRRQILTILVTLGALTIALLFSGAAARAEVTHEYLSRFGEVPAVGPHGETVSQPGALEFIRGMAFDAGSGELYVEDGRLDVFGAAGAFTSQLSQLPAPYDFDNQSVAVGHSTGETEVYDVADEGSGSEAVGVVAVYDAAGGVQGYWRGADTPAKTFQCFECGSSGGVAVDDSTNPLSTGDVYVSVPEERVVDVFEAKAGGGEQYITQLAEREPGVPFEEVQGVTVDNQNGDLLVSDGKSVDVFEPTALHHYTLVRRITGTSEGPFHARIGSVAVDAGNGEIFLDEYEGPFVFEFDSEGVYLGRLTGTPAGPLQRPYALAADPANGDVYVSVNIEESGRPNGYVDVFGPDVIVPDVTTSSASAVTHGGATLTGTVNPDNAGEATCRFVWGTSTEFGKVAPCEPEGVANGSSPVAVHATLSGLQPDTTYYYRIEATNKANGYSHLGEPAQDQQFTTAGPGIEEESVTSAAATSATLDASIDPNDAPTSYYFQYGTSAAYGEEVPLAPGAEVGSGKGAVEVSQHVQGLTANTVYHYRVVVVSEVSPGEVEVVQGADETFSTQPPGYVPALPDGRQWEMVSPPEKRGGQLNEIGEFGVIEASVNGNALTYTASVPTEADPHGYAEQAQLLSTRGPQGWATADIDPPHAFGTGPSVGFGQQYRAFSEDLSLSAVQPFGGFDPALSPEASEQTSYLRSTYLNGNVEEPCLPSAANCYRPFVTGKPGYANVPAGTVFGEQEAGEERECLGASAVCGPVFVGGAPDLEHALVVVDPNAPQSAGGDRLYEWGEGKLTRIQGLILPNDMARHEISDDGSRVIFEGSPPEGGGIDLSMEDTVTGETVRLDAVQGGTGEDGIDPQVQTASTDGSKVFFTDSQQLTASSHQFDDERSLYECEMVEAAGKLSCKLADLTPAQAGEAGVQGEVLGTSEDGSYVYFVANGAFAAGAVHGTCNGEQGRGTCNLYVRHGGVTKLVAVLSGQDSSDWSAMPNQTARVSSDGRWLTFMSQRELTGYATSDAVNGKPDEEVYLYDASTGALVCASCNPTGSRPVGSEKLNESGYVPKGQLAATLPPWTTVETSKNSMHQPRYLADSGRLFFDSADALVPQDVNGAEDVYEYEPAGVGDCTSASATYSARASGCVDLISSGTSAEQSVFLDASGGGGDVFFLTAAKLSPQDLDTALDVYDAHECTAAAPCYPTALTPPPPCDTGDACKPSPTPQPAIFGTPSSATFSGAGNILPSATAPTVKRKQLSRAQELAQALRACRAKRAHRRRVSCERQARAHYARNASSRANNASMKGGRG